MEQIIARSGTEIELGRWGENLARCVVFDISHWQETYGEGTVQLLHQRCGDSAPYPCVIQTVGAQVRWEITDTDVALPGRGSAELQYYVGETRVKSETYHTRTRQALSSTGPVPDDPQQSWVDQVLEQGAAVLEAEQRTQVLAGQAEEYAGQAETAASSAAASARAAGQSETVCADYAAYVEEEAERLAEHENGRIAALEQADAAMDARVTALEEQAADSDELDALTGRTATLEQQMADLLYEPISITSFSHNAGTVEMGNTVTDVRLSWSVNKQPATLTLDGESLSTSLVWVQQTGLNITKDNGKTWTLKATDERSATATRTTAVSFQNGIYYGAAAAPEAIDSAFIMGLAQKTLSGTKNRTVSITGGDGLYAWYAYPKRLGTSLFNIGGFDYEYERSTVSFTNSCGFTEDYYVYRSGQYAPASLSVTVKNGG